MSGDTGISQKHQNIIDTFDKKRKIINLKPLKQSTPKKTNPMESPRKTPSIKRKSQSDLKLSPIKMRIMEVSALDFWRLY